MTHVTPIGSRLRAERNRRGLGQRELADRWHVSQNTIHNWEIGKSKPTDEHLPLIWEFIGADEEEARDLLYRDSIDRAGLKQDAGKDWSAAARTILRRKGR